MHDQVEGAVIQTVVSSDLFLDGAQELRTQLDVTGLVRTVHVTEGQSGNVTALFAKAQGLNGLDGICGRGVQLLVDFANDTVFFATHSADLDLEDGVRVNGQLQQALCNLKVLIQRNGGAIPHVGLEPGKTASLNFLGLHVHELLGPGIQVLLCAVVGVQGNGDVVVLCDLTGVGSHCQRAGDTVLDGGT